MFSPFSRIFGGGCKEENERLDAVNKEMLDHVDDEGDKDLDVIASHSKELCNIMDVEVGRGAKDRNLLQRIDDISGIILSNLEKRLTVDLFSSADGEDVSAKLLAIAKDLDMVRATRASSVITAKASEIQEKATEEEVKQVGKEMEALKSIKVAELVAAVRPVLDAVEAAHRKAPTSKKITDMLLGTAILPLATLFLKHLPQVLKLDAGNVEGAQAAAERLDTIGGELVVVMQAKWDPLVKTRVEEIVRTQAMSVFNVNVAILEGMIAPHSHLDLEAVNKAVVALGPWWSHAFESKGVGKRLQGVCDKIDEQVVGFVKDCVKNGDLLGVETLLKFADEYDTACTSFEGIDLADSSLRQQLLAEDVFSGAGKQLDALDAKLAGASTIEPATMSMAMKVLQALVPAWTAACKADESLSEHLGKTLSVLEERVQDTVSESQGCVVAVGLLRFAAKYDELIPQLSPEAGGLQQRIAPSVVDSCLKMTETEIGKSDGVNPLALLKALEALKTPQLKNTLAAEDVQARLANCLRVMEDRILQAFLKSKANGDQKKSEGLFAFAQKFDTVCAEIELRPNDGEEHMSLEQRLKLLGALAAAEVELSLGPKLNPEALAGTLAEIRSLCTAAKESESRLTALFRLARPALLASMSTADAAAADAILLCGQEVEQLRAVLQKKLGSDGEVADLECADLCKVLQRVREAVRQLENLDVALGKTAGMNPNDVLGSLEALKANWDSVDGIPALNKRLVQIFGLLEDRLAEACEKAISAGENKKVQALLSFASRCDQVREAAAGDAQLCSRLVDILGAARLDAAEQELNKEKGMNPVTVLSCLKSLHSIWEQVDADSPLHGQADGVRKLILTRMQASMDEAANASNRRKAEALVKFGMEYDEVLSVISIRGGISQELAVSLLRVASGTGAGTGDDFMSPEWRAAEDFMSTEAIGRAFRKYDTEGNGKMTKVDFAKVIKALDSRFTEDVVDSLFAAADTDSDGTLGYEEFIAWLFER